MSTDTSGRDYSRLTKQQLEEILREPALSQAERSRVADVLTMRIKEELLKTSGEEILSKPPPAPYPNPPPRPAPAPPIPIRPIEVPMSAGVYAGFWKRFAAALIDAVVGGILGGIAGGIMGFLLAIVGANDQSVITVCGNIVGVIIGWLYFALMESSKNQGTLGKMALGIKVTDLSGAPISFGKASGRHFAKIVSGLILGIGFLMVAFSEKKQGLHDMMAGCLVVNK